MSLEDILTSLAALVHANLTVVSVASALVILGLLFGDLEDYVLYGLANGWRKLASLNVLFDILAADTANTTAAGVAALAFLGALGAGAGYRDAALTALVAIGTVNTGYLFGADRDKLAAIIAAIKARSAPRSAAPVTPAP